MNSVTIRLSEQPAFVRTLRDVRGADETAGTQVLLRAGYISQVASGIYHYHPLAVRVLNRIKAIIHQEMQKIGGQEVIMPLLQPASLWELSGRWEKMGEELMRVQGRNDKMYALSPTHEEAVVHLLDKLNVTYKQLPFHLYQIQTKVRDEVRPRFGLVRAKEFIMKDGYSFHKSEEDLKAYYEKVGEGYLNIFQRIGLDARPVEADSGMMQGGESREYVVFSESGEDHIAYCSHCDRAVNVEKASFLLKPNGGALVPEKKRVHTGVLQSIEDLQKEMSWPVDKIVKTLLYNVDGQVKAFSFPSDRVINEVKIKNMCGATEVALASAAMLKPFPLLKVGYLGPVNWTHDDIPHYYDRTLQQKDDLFTGANEKEYHYEHVVVKRDFSSGLIEADFVNAQEGDICASCQKNELKFETGVELAHIFQLGTRYTEALGVSYRNQDGEEKSPIMGCYGIGVSRILAALSEVHHDEKGLIFPQAVAPFDVLLIILPSKDDDLRQKKEKDLIRFLEQEGFAVCIDDRSVRPGVKFCDGDLIGVPIHVIVGGRGLSEGFFEVKQRQGDLSEKVPFENIENYIQSVVFRG